MIKSTNIDEIQQYLSGKPAAAAYPSNLPLDLLKCIARDLREYEVSMSKMQETMSLAAPLLLILHIVTGGSDDSKTPKKQSFGEEDIYLWIQKITYFIERELVGRVVGVSIYNNEEFIKHFSNSEVH